MRKLASLLLLISAPALAQIDVRNFPSRPIRIVVPQSPGGSTDLTARLIAQRLAEVFKQPAVVDNRPGAGSTSGTEIVVRSAPDGHTLLVVASSLTINPALYTRLSYDAIRDFAPITQLSRFPNLIAAHPSVPVKTLGDMIALAKAKPGRSTTRRPAPEPALTCPWSFCGR